MTPSRLASAAPAAPDRARRAFTLVEILIVVVVMALLASLVVPSLANATAPLPRAVSDLLEADFRRARVEAIGTVREIHMVAGADRDRWWLQPAGPLNSASALPASLRILGNGNLSPFAGLRLEPTIDSKTLSSGPASFAVFSTEGLRTMTRLELELVASVNSQALIRWEARPQRTQLVELPPKNEKDKKDEAKATSAK